MTQRSNSADLAPLVSREQAENAFRDAMNLFVGRGRRYNVPQLAKGSRVAERTIECFRSYSFGHPDYRPLHFGHMLSIAAFLGAEFTSEWLGLAEQGAFDFPDDGDPRPGDVALESAEDTTEIVRRAADGKFCGDDRKALKVVGLRKIQRGHQLVAAAARADAA